MKKFLIIPAMLLALSGCNPGSEVVTTTQFARISIPSEYYNCPDPKIPAGQKIKESDVAHYIVLLKQSRDTCKLSLDTIQKWVDSYNATIK